MTKPYQLSKPHQTWLNQTKPDQTKLYFFSFVFVKIESELTNRKPTWSNFTKPNQINQTNPILPTKLTKTKPNQTQAIQTKKIHKTGSSWPGFFVCLFVKVQSEMIERNPSKLNSNQLTQSKLSFTKQSQIDQTKPDIARS